MSELAELQEKFTQVGVYFYQKEALVFIELENDFGKLVITTQGANLVEYYPKSCAGRGGVLWVSSDAIYDGSKPVRGGVPICWPWFGAHPTNENLPAHGFARTQIWDLAEVAPDNSFIKMSLTDNEQTRKIWNVAFELELKVELAESLTMTLTATNKSNAPLLVSEALHSYFQVEDVEAVKILGLQNAEYFDKNLDFAKQKLTEELQVKSPLDWVFTQQTSDLIIQDRQRKIQLSKQAANSTIVWNPGQVGVVSFADIPDASYKDFICLEAGNALSDSYELAAGASHSLVMNLKVMN